MKDLRSAGLLKHYVHHRGLVLCTETGRLRQPLENASSKTVLPIVQHFFRTDRISGWLSLV